MTDSVGQNEIERVRTALRSARSVFVLTGAGISAESGVPTFRGGGGAPVWRGMPFEELSSAEMVVRDLPLVWEWFDYRLGIVGDCAPNPGHLALAEIQQSGRFEEFTLVTQNIDGLHAQAGSTEPIELHGNIQQARCPSCGLILKLDQVAGDDRPPVCPDCAARMRPNVVLFGENLPVDAIMTAQDRAAGCDVCLVVGTSALVYPAAALPGIAKNADAFLVEINPEQTALTPICDVSIRGKSGDILPLIFG